MQSFQFYIPTIIIIKLLRRSNSQYKNFLYSCNFVSKYKYKFLRKDSLKIIGNCEFFEVVEIIYPR